MAGLDLGLASAADESADGSAAPDDSPAHYPDLGGPTLGMPI